ncbi:adenylosuccinate lyase [Buchnera aphidicola]|uniref:adenylosuccinate lyase n=1 Tax=Buchnera aphidicola TaxID=9 RepID=UPI0034648E1C
MNNFCLTAISPIDGRYHKNTSILKNIFSEYAFLKFRIKIEICWLKKLSSIPDVFQLPTFNENTNKILSDIIKNFDYEDAKKIKEIEKSTCHDVKAIEYFLSQKISVKLNDPTILNFIHFACTSDDINNLAYAVMLKKTRSKVLIPYWKKILLTIKDMAINFQNVTILSRTHGQPATPSTVGKEMLNFYYRLYRQYNQLKNIIILGKFNGTVGNYNAHMTAYPLINWSEISEEFVNSLGIDWNPCTTQIEPHDYISEIFSCICRFNTILINFNQDIWGYISLNYFKQKTKQNEIGSSIMPHKVNPIDFEKSEGNLGLSNSIMNHMIAKLPISRWQRDLTDSTILRNIGVTMGYSIIAYESLLIGLSKITVNFSELKNSLNDKWVLLAEPIQTMMRKYGISNGYEELKKITRGNYVDALIISQYIENLNIPDYEKDRLKKITPHNYIGDVINIIQKNQ